MSISNLLIRLFVKSLIWHHTSSIFGEDNSMRYVDGFVQVVPKKKMAQYVRIAKIACKVWQDHGALEYLECVGDDLDVQCGTTFPQLLALKSGETAIFSYIVYKS